MSIHTVTPRDRRPQAKIGELVDTSYLNDLVDLLNADGGQVEIDTVLVLAYAGEILQAVRPTWGLTTFTSRWPCRPNTRGCLRTTSSMASRCFIQAVGRTPAPIGIRSGRSRLIASMRSSMPVTIGQCSPAGRWQRYFFVSPLFTSLTLGRKTP